MAPRKAKPDQKQTPRRRSLGVRAIDGLIANPVGTGGGLVMMAMASAILVNALAMQPGIHPAPLFQNTRPVAADPAPTQALPEPGTATGDDIDAILTRTTGRPSSVDSGLVAEIQTELKRLGYYDGTIDGLPGPMTSTAVLAFEKDHGLDPLGEPSGNVLAALRAGGRPAEPAPVEPTPTVAEEVPADPSPATLPRPRPRADQRAAATVEPVEAPADGIAALLATPEEDGAIVTAAVATTVEPVSESGDPRLAKIQQSLDLLGFGPLRPDGHWSPETRAAIKRFEQYRGLPLTGELNETFLAELIRIGGLSLN